MATTSDRRNSDVRSGGKILRNRRIPPANRTPYARPAKVLEKVQPEEPENPNWFSGLIYPAKVIASGAGKILSFFGPDSSSSSSDGDSSENDDDVEEIEDDVSFQGGGRSNKALSSSSKSDSKHVIERLVMQRTFSRDEGNELIQLIKSRVVDTEGTFDESVANMRTMAIMEARKWLQHKRSGSKKIMEHEVHSTPLATPSKVSENGLGSPVDMAKSYMQNRPGWASRSLKQTEFASPFSLNMLQVGEKTPKSTLHTSEMRSSLSSGSWNILEEIRRVRSKATENFLTTSPLTKTRLSSFSPALDRPKDSLMNNRDTTGSSHHRPDVSISHPSRVDQDGGAVRSTEDQECKKATADLNSNDDIEVKEMRSTAAENAYPSTASGLTAGRDATQEAVSPEKERNGNLVISSQAVHIHMEDSLNPELQPAVDISNVNPSDIVVSESQNSSSMQQADLSQELSQSSVEPIPKPKANASKEKKSKTYVRKGRGRGK